MVKSTKIYETLIRGFIFVIIDNFGINFFKTLFVVDKRVFRAVRFIKQVSFL